MTVFLRPAFLYDLSTSFEIDFLFRTLFIFLKGLSQDENSLKFSETITELDLSNLLYKYSSDYFEGRGTGQKGQKKAVEFLKNYYIKEGISPGKNSKNYFLYYLIGKQLIYI